MNSADRTFGDDTQALPAPTVSFIVLAMQTSFGVTEPAASTVVVLLLSSASR